MKMRKTKKEKQIMKKSVALFVAAGLCLLFFIGYLIFYLINENQYYKVVSRTREVKESVKKQKDNYKVVGWLKVQGTNIDYPVIYAPNLNVANMVDDFVWTEADYEELNNIIYISGHNILNLSKQPIITDETHSRFEQLMSFTYLDFVKENKYIQYTFNGKEYVYKIFAISYPSKQYPDVYNNSKYTKEQMKNFVSTAKENSIFKFDVDVDENDKVISLITCTTMFTNVSFEVDARLVREHELKNNYDVEETKAYAKVKENLNLKGGSSNEET